MDFMVVQSRTNIMAKDLLKSSKWRRSVSDCESHYQFYEIIESIFLMLKVQFTPSRNTKWNYTCHWQM